MSDRSQAGVDEFIEFRRLVNNCDPDDPLLSSTKLGLCLDQVPLHFLNPAELSNLTQALNIEQLITTETGLARDYRGLAELMGFKSAEIETRFKRVHNPTKSLIDAYTILRLDQSTAQQASRCITVNDLLKLIELIERFDVIDDFIPTLIELAAKYQSVNHNVRQQQLALVARDAQLNTPHPINTRLTIDDSLDLNDVTMYDAFVCFASEDFHHAQELISIIERNGKKLAVADDLLPGQFEFDALAQLINSRCRKVIVILTPNFTRSKECKFQTKFASEIAVKDGYQSQIIPVLYEACDDQLLPPMIRVISKIDMTTKSNPWQINKLLRSLDFRPAAKPVALPAQSFQLDSLSISNNHNSNSPDLQSSTPFIILPESSCNLARHSPSNDSAGTSQGPIVNLKHSESSMQPLYEDSSNIDSRSNGSTGSQAHIKKQHRKQQHSMTISSTLGRLKSFGQRMLGNGSSLESISSQAILLRSTSPESSEDIDDKSKMIEK